MRKPGKLTKSEILLLAATVLFVASVLAIRFSGSAGDSRDGYSVRTSRAAERSAAPAELIDINTADKTTLQQLPGIGEALAERIIEERTANGPYASVDDLTRVSGIGESKLETLRPYVTVQGAGEEAQREDTGG